MGNTHMTFLEKFWQDRGSDTIYVKRRKEKIYNQDTQHSKAIIEIWRRGSFTYKQKLWEFGTTKPGFTKNVKQTSLNEKKEEEKD